jgi:hypothetical protein
MRTRLGNLLIVLAIFGCENLIAEPLEIYCAIRSSGGNLNCQMMGKERKVMNAEDITNFVDAAEVAAYITLKSRKGMERTFLIDRNAPQYKRLNDVKRSASMSEIAKAKSDLFNEIEKKVIKLSDELDGQSAAAELVLYDPSVTYDKLKRTNHEMMAELDGYRKNKDKVCTSTPAFEQMSKANSRLQQTLSNILYAFQTPDSCMSDYKVFKDHDGSVDLRQLDSVNDHFKANCRKR